MSGAHQTVKWDRGADPTGRETREFTISRGAARPITGALWPPKGGLPAQTSHGLVLFGHGASGDRYQRPIPHLAKRFCDEAGVAALSVDGPVHGRRQAGVGGRAALAEEIRRPSYIDDMVEDWQHAIDAARELDDVGTGELAYFGLSMGSMFGVPLLATRNDVKVATLGLLGMSGPVARLPERYLRDAAAISCPLLFLMQLEDELFAREGCLELFDAFASPDKRLHANPGLHPEIPQEEIDFSFEFMRSHLEGRAARRIVNPLAE